MADVVATPDEKIRRLPGSAGKRARTVTPAGVDELDESPLGDVGGSKENYGQSLGKRVANGQTASVSSRAPLGEGFWERV